MTAYKRPVFFDRDLKSFSELSADSGLDLGIVARSILADSYLQVGTTGADGQFVVKNAADVTVVQALALDPMRNTPALYVGREDLSGGVIGILTGPDSDYMTANLVSDGKNAQVFIGQSTGDKAAKLSLDDGSCELAMWFGTRKLFLDAVGERVLIGPQGTEAIKLEALTATATIGGPVAGTVSVKNASDVETISLSTSGSFALATIGGAGQSGVARLKDGAENNNVVLDGSVGVLQLNYAGTGGIQFEAKDAYAKIGNGGAPGLIHVFDSSVTQRIELKASTGSITLSGAASKLTGLVTAEITQPLDAVNKAYVDSIAQGLAVKGACHVSSQANIEVLATTTEVDGHTLVEGERVLVRYQASQVENGIYRFDGTGLVRSADMADGSHAAGAFTFVQFGTNADQGWVCTADAPADVVGTNALPWTQFSAAGVIEAGDGLQLIGTVMSAKLDGTTLSASVDGIKVLGLPEMFEVGGVAVSATVTAPALDTLTAGFASDARLLHAHSCDRNTLPTATPTLASKAVVVDSSGQAVAAGTSSAGAWVVGYCTQVIDESAYVIRSGIADGTLVGATPGDVYYVQADGTIGTALPSEGRVIMIGVAISEFDLFVQIRDFGAILAA